MKKIVLPLFAVLAFGAFAVPHGHCPGPCRPGPYRPHHPPPSHCYRGDWWGRGGCNFWPSFTGALVGSAIGSSVSQYNQPSTIVVTQPVVQQPAIQQPVVVAQPAVSVVPTVQTVTVWVEGRYVDTVQPNGTTIRTWEPGHYETRQVVR